ncbi:MAG: tyrosine-type recombinase/integrase [Variibacter sp.]|nr:tyrosine-type recombinase/integrase [Variibacter sp.]
MRRRRKGLPCVEFWRDRYGKLRTYFRRGKGPRIPLPGAFGSDEFNAAYAAALNGSTEPPRPALAKHAAGTIGTLITAYLKSSGYRDLSEGSKSGYMSRLEIIRREHGHRTVSGLTRERIEALLQAYDDRPSAKLDTLKKLRILIAYAIDLKWIKSDPSRGIKRPKSNEFRAWTDAEIAAFEKRWPIGTKQRTAYALMLYVGAARADVHQMTWRQIDGMAVGYTRKKTGVGIEMDIHSELRKALGKTDRNQVTIINTEFGKPFTVSGFGNFMRDAIRAADLPADCKPHGLRKTLGRRLADAGCSAHDIMAALGHKSLAEAERYTREADRRRGGKRAVRALEAHMKNRNAQTTSKSLGKSGKPKGKST